MHNKHFLDLLEHPHNLTAVQSMSAVYTYDTRNKYHTPMEASECPSPVPCFASYSLKHTELTDMLPAVEPMFKHPWYRSERTLTRTLNSAWYVSCLSLAAWPSERGKPAALEGGVAYHVQVP